MIVRSFLFLIPVLFFSCTNPSEQTSDHQKKNCDQWLANEYARHFTIRVCDGDTVLFLLNPDNPEDTLHRFSTGKKLNLTTISTTHVAMFAALDALDALSGVGYADYIVDSDVKQRLEDGRIRAITSADQLNFETVVDIGPDVLMVYPYGNENYDRYENAGIAVLPIAEYAENHPLGRSEWIKVFGLLTGNFSKAEEIFKETAERYQYWQSRSAEIKNKPVVFTGSFYKGRWSAPAGESFIAQFIRDAGAEYAFADYPGHHNTELDFEVVLRKMAEADFFGKVIHRETQVKREDFMEDNARFELIRTFGDDQLFYCNTMTTDYFGRGLLEPDLMLRDLFHIFHPDADAAADTVSFQYFKPLSR